jgi:hypothetical protein
MADSDGEFRISVNVPLNASHLVFPLEFRSIGATFRYYLQIQIGDAEIKGVAQPVVVQSKFDFCTRNMTTIGWGLTGAAQKQVTSPIYSETQLQSFVFDSLSAERRQFINPEMGYRIRLTYNTFRVTSILDQGGSHQSVLLASDVLFSSSTWRRTVPHFRLHYGLSGGVMLEQRPFLLIKSIDKGGVFDGRHIALNIGGYAEFFSKTKNQYGEVGFNIQPLFVGINHHYQGVGAIGHIGYLRALGYSNSIGVYSFGHLFIGNQKDRDYSSEISMFQTHLELRYGWMF